MANLLIYLIGGILLVCFLLMNWRLRAHEASKIEHLSELLAIRQTHIEHLDAAKDVMKVVAEIATDATGVNVPPEKLRREDRLDSELHLGLDSLSFFNLEAELSRKFGIRLRFPRHCNAEPTIDTLIQLVEESSKKASKSDQ
jgi:acyl carrier protein